MPAAYRAFLVEWYPDIRTDRGRQDVAYRFRAMDVLGDDSRFAWLYDPQTIAAGGGGLKMAILSELGRFRNDETLKTFALRICELKPKTKEAVAMLRRARLVREAKTDCLRLTRSIETCLDDYRAARPSTPKRVLLTALQNATDAVEATYEPAAYRPSDPDEGTRGASYAIRSGSG